MITLAQALHIRHYIEMQREALAREREEAAFKIKLAVGVAEEKGADIFTISQKLAAVTSDFIQLNKLIMEANATQTLTFEGDVLTIGEAIDLSKVMRREAKWFLDMASRAGVIECSTGATSPIKYLKASTFTKEEAKETGFDLSRRSNALSLLINEANEKVLLDFDAAKYVA